MLLMVWGLSKAIAAPAIAYANADRIAYAIHWAAVPALLLFAMYAAVGNARFFGEAIDPTLGKEDRTTIVDGRVADNTTQQFLLFLIGLFALAVTLPNHRLSIIPAVSITFVDRSDRFLDRIPDTTGPSRLRVRFDGLHEPWNADRLDLALDLLDDWSAGARRHGRADDRGLAARTRSRPSGFFAGRSMKLRISPVSTTWSMPRPGGSSSSSATREGTLEPRSVAPPFRTTMQ